MPPALAALLWVLGLCLSQKTSTQMEPLPTPLLAARPSSMVPQGRPVMLRCQGATQALEYQLHFGGQLLASRRPEPRGRRDRMDFLVPAMTLHTAGRYRCCYRGPEQWSEPSNILELVVTELYDTPRLSVHPGPRVTPGEDVTFYCHLEAATSKFFLVKKGQGSKPQSRHGAGQVAFALGPVTTAHRGTYRCFGSYNDYAWSFPSEPLRLLVIDGLENSSSAPADTSSPDAWDAYLSVTEPGFQDGRKPRPLGPLDPEPPAGWPGRPGAADRRGAPGGRLAQPQASSGGDREGFSLEKVLDQQSEEAELRAELGLGLGWEKEARLPDNTGAGLYPHLEHILSNGPGVATLSFTESAAWAPSAENRVRLGLAGLVLLVLGVLLAEDWDPHPSPSPRPPCSWFLEGPFQILGVGQGTQGLGIMAGLLPTLLCLGWCVGWRVQALTEFGPRPRIMAGPTSLVLRGQSVIILCQGPRIVLGEKVYRIDRDGCPVAGDTELLRVASYGVSLHITNMTAAYAGLYTCSYQVGDSWSLPSLPLALFMAGAYDKPSLSSLEGSTAISTAFGTDVKLRCFSRTRFDVFILVRNYEKDTVQNQSCDPQDAHQAIFSLDHVTFLQAGTYRCFGALREQPYVWSYSSDPLQLEVTENPTTTPLPPDREEKGESAAWAPSAKNRVRLGLAGLILLVLGVLLAEAWCSHHRTCPAPRGSS
ncbi:uncharacterized protein LOC103124474 [Erinaceus europaeus]|uniref:Natural cytotoxicity triggering receptor 1 n=1 Tax=Erinaceus europaeus TaxID=9365 RepID=A0ABM3X116_ERIEU|nr:uncharacterized protein LOC103124474 [Erinaceus europaeus]